MSYGFLLGDRDVEKCLQETSDLRGDITSYHPQTSALVEKTNGTIMQMLQTMLEDWYVLLDGVLVFYITR